MHNEAERTAKREKRRKEKVQREAAKAVGEEEQRRQQAELELLLIDEHALRDQAVLGATHTFCRECHYQSYITVVYSRSACMVSKRVLSASIMPFSGLL